MQIDATNFPFVRLREHEDDQEHDGDAELAMLKQLLSRGEPFAIIAEAPPKFPDPARGKSEDRAKAAKLFKTLRTEFSRLCVSFVVIVGQRGLSFPMQKAIQGVTAAMGVPLSFAADEATAEGIARDRLRG